MNSIVIKVQSVRSIRCNLEPKNKLAMSVGQYVDNLLIDLRVNKNVPNKLVIDLNPPPEDNPADVGDDLGPPLI